MGDGRTGVGVASDFARYDSDGTYGRIVAANIAASAENTWTNSANAYTVASGTYALTGTRTMMACVIPARPALT